MYDEDRKDPLAAEKDIVLCWRCTLHVASSGIHWGQLNATASSSTLDDIHIGIKSLRNSSLTILELVDPFVQEHVRFTREPPENADHVEVLWRVLGVSGPMLTVVVDMDPFWNAADSVLEVSQRFQVDPHRFEKVANLLMFFFRWLDFSETRWAGVVRSAQKCVASLLVGIEQVVTLAYRRKRNTYYLGGFTRLSRAARRYLCIAAVAQRPLENFVLSLLQDDRFLRNCHALRTALTTDAIIVRALPMYVFERLAMAFCAGRFEAASLRHDSIHAVLVGLGYLEREAFALLKCPPFCWTQGNLINNVADIRGVANPSDVATRKLKIMPACGMADDVVVSTLELIRDAPCSVALCEKTHGAGSLLARAHGLYSSDKLALRSLVCSARPMFTLSKVLAKEAKLRARLDKHRAPGSALGEE